MIKLSIHKRWLCNINSIIIEIGIKPILSFGNSVGHVSIANFVVNNNKYSFLAFQVCCDGLERENGNLEKANKLKQLCKENNWEAIALKDDWKTIYGYNVKRNFTSFYNFNNILSFINKFN